jgi:hypothetical protein
MNEDFYREASRAPLPDTEKKVARYAPSSSRRASGAVCCDCHDRDRRRLTRLNAAFKFVAEQRISPCGRCFAVRFARSVVNELLPLYRENTIEPIEFWNRVEAATARAIVTQCQHYQ